MDIQKFRDACESVAIHFPREGQSETNAACKALAFKPEIIWYMIQHHIAPDGRYTIEAPEATDRLIFVRRMVKELQLCAYGALSDTFTQPANGDWTIGFVPNEHAKKIIMSNWNSQVKRDFYNIWDMIIAQNEAAAKWTSK